MWRVFIKKRKPVEIIAIDHDERTILCRNMPTSQRLLIDALIVFWKDNEVPWSITEVLRYEKPQHVFWKVMWREGE